MSNNSGNMKETTFVIGPRTKDYGFMNFKRNL